MRFMNTSNLGLHPRLWGLLNLIFPSESGYNLLHGHAIFRIWFGRRGGKICPPTHTHTHQTPKPVLIMLLLAVVRPWIWSEVTRSPSRSWWSPSRTRRMLSERLGNCGSWRWSTTRMWVEDLFEGDFVVEVLVEGGLEGGGLQAFW